MDYKDFTPKDEAFKKFVAYRKQIMDAADKGKFEEVFFDVVAKAMDGDCIAQDCAAYFYNKGFDDFQPNFENYMSWEILAAANGNEFAIEKLQYFLAVALDEFVYGDNGILKTALIRGNVTKENAIYVISNLICEGIVDQLQIEPKKLISMSRVASEYTPAKNRIFITAMENSLADVAEYLVS